MRSTKSPFLELFSERTSSIYYGVIHADEKFLVSDLFGSSYFHLSYDRALNV